METKMHLQRYFCKYFDREKIARLGEFIYPTDDTDPFTKDTENTVWPRPWDHYKKYRSIVLLGPPRQGKTREFEYQCSLIGNGFFLPLRDILDPNSLEEAFDAQTRQRWAQWLRSNLTGEIFIDALDEGKLQAPKMIKYIIRWLDSLGNPVLERLRVHLSCRESDWMRIDEDAWGNIFQVNTTAKERRFEDYVVLALLDLTESAIRENCEQRGIDADSFLFNLPSHAKSFLQRPHTLDMLLEEYSNTASFPPDIQELYEKVVDLRLQEFNEYRQESVGDIPLLEKRIIAEFYAVSTQMSGREIIAEFAVDLTRHLSFGFSGESSDHEKLVFSTALFERYTSGQYRFADPGLTDYLAARRLNELVCRSSITPERLVRLFFPDATSKDLIPRFRYIVGWLCALNPAVRRVIIRRNASLILHDYVGNLSDQDRVAIWGWFMERYSGREWFGIRQFLPNVKQLACEALVPDLIMTLRDKQHFGRDLRILAIEIARYGRLKAITADLVTVVQDPDEHPDVKRQAAWALKEAAPEELSVLKAWFHLSPEQDSENDLLGTALDLLWPDHIDLATVITNLHEQRSDHFGPYRTFLHELPTRLSPSDRARMLDEFAKALEKILKDLLSDKEGVRREGIFHPAFDFDRFLLSQIEDWKDLEEKRPQLEQWLSLLVEASTYDLVTGTETQKIKDLIQREHKLRQSLVRLRVERLSIPDTSDRLDIILFVHNNLYVPQKEDIDFWKQLLDEWGTREDKLLEGTWECFQYAWASAGYPSNMLDWIEGISERLPAVGRLWERAKICPFDSNMQWRWKEADRKRQHELKESQWRKLFNESIPLLQAGNERLLVNLVANHRRKSPTDPIDKWVQHELDHSVAQAFIEGVKNYWQTAGPPDLSSVYMTDQIPWWSSLVLLAVDSWVSYEGGDWKALPSLLRQKALIAGLWELNRLPDWYSEVISLEPSHAQDLLTRVLDMEAASDNSFPRLASNLRDQGKNPDLRQIFFQYLTLRPNLRIHVLTQLLKCFIAETLSDSEGDTIWKICLSRYDAGDNMGALLCLAALWRYHPLQAWKWLNENYLGTNATRQNRFDEWISAIEEIHLTSLYHGWPAWVDEKSLFDMLPDLHATYPPSSDPSVKDLNSGDQVIQRRYNLSHLRNNALQRLAESGTDFAGESLYRLKDSPNMQQHHDILSYFLDIWRQAYADRCWRPLAPGDLWGILTKGMRPVQTHEDLFSLTCEILDEIAMNIQGGEIPVKELLWHKTDSGWKPREERVLQILLGDKLANHPIIRNQHLVSGRELEVGGNYPDIFVVCVLPTNERAKVYIEVKRQQHEDLLTALQSQLAEKYLKDPESRYGIYLVGWYGVDQYEISDKHLLKVFNDIPTTPESLQTALQKLCDHVVKDNKDIQGIRAKIVDLSRK